MSVAGNKKRVFITLDIQNRITSYNIGLTIIKSEYTQTCV